MVLNKVLLSLSLKKHRYVSFQLPKITILPAQWFCSPRLMMCYWQMSLLALTVRCRTLSVILDNKLIISDHETSRNLWVDSKVCIESGVCCRNPLISSLCNLVAILSFITAIQRMATASRERTIQNIKNTTITFVYGLLIGCSLSKIAICSKFATIGSSM